jgi:hypothetical protein
MVTRQWKKTPDPFAYPGVSPMLDSQWYDRAKAIRQTIVQLRDSL